MTDLRCVDKACADGPRDDDQQPRPRWATTGLLCTRCAQALEQRLAELPARRDHLRAVLGGRQGPISDGSKRTKGTPPVPLNLDAHDHLVAMHATVVSWVRLVCEERGLRGPDRDDVAFLAPWLVAQMDWLVGQPWVDDLADEIRDASRVADALTGTTRKPRRAGADCFECGSALVRPVVDGLEEDAVTCLGCGQQYDDSQYFMALQAAAWQAARVEVDGETWATPTSLAHDLERSENTLHRWRRDGLVRARRVSGVTFFHLGDAEQEHASRGVRRSA